MTRRRYDPAKGYAAYEAKQARAAAKVKVYAITTHVRLADGGWSPRQLSATIAAPSRAAAARALGVSTGTVAKFASDNAGGSYAAIALSEPGTVFVRPAGSYDDKAWKRLSEVTR